MNNYIEYFSNYINMNYDMSNDLISLKFYHSIRVAKLMYILASKMNMSDDDRLLAFKIGLCHDLGRFYEVIRNQKFNNQIFDHAAYSNKVLYNDGFIDYMNIKEHLLMKKAIYNHNKKDIKNDLTEREKIFANLLRDADKIDILYVRSLGKSLVLNSNINPIILKNFYHNNMIDLADIKNKADSSVLYLSFIKDLYYMVSHDFVNNNGYTDNILSIIKVEDKDLFESLIEKVKNERGKVYVR